MSFTQVKGLGLQVGTAPQRQRSSCGEVQAIPTASYRTPPSVDKVTALGNFHHGEIESPARSLQPEALWDEAFGELRKENDRLVRDYQVIIKQSVNTKVPDTASIQGFMFAVLSDRLCDVKRKCYKISLWGKQIDISDRVQKIVKAVEIFQGAGNVVASVDPAHFGIPWAGVCLLLLFSTMLDLNLAIVNKRGHVALPHLSVREYLSRKVVGEQHIYATE
ncbi:hypothetical protein BJX99DRAFT_259492 [Aspergillus californicus]